MSIRKMSSSANQPVWVGSSRSWSSGRTYMNARPADASRYLTVPDVSRSTPSCSDVERDRTGCLIAVREAERAPLVGEARDLGDVEAVPGAVRDRGAADERRALVDRLGEALERDAAVVVRTHVHDLGAAELLRMGDLADGRELELGDHDPGSAAPRAGAR